MRSESFKKLTYKELKCRCCGRIFPINTFSSRMANADGTAKFCKTCEWIDRHGGIPKVEEFTEEQIKRTLDFMLFQESNYVNDLASILNKTIEEAIFLIKQLKIGNRHYDVKFNCDCCGKETSTTPAAYMIREFHYCSLECYWKDKTNRVPHGKDSPYYNRIRTTCTNCGKEIEVIPFDYNLKNEYGDNNNFCCQECYWEYRSKYYVGEKSSMWNKQPSEETKEKLRLATAMRCSVHDQVNSAIQLKVNQILDDINIKYTREYVVKYYSVDNYLDDYNLMIEVMGDYWHANPIKYNSEKYSMNQKQFNGIHRDKIKHSYIKNHNNIEFLYLWESDINKKPQMCKKLIEKYIENNGVLANYHSFNWELDNNGELLLCQKIITPYQDMKVDEYRHLIKKKVG